MINLLTIFFVLVGLFFYFGGTIGILRFPDFYSRLHPAGKVDTLGSMAVLIGLALYTGQSLVLIDILTALKIILCVVFFFVANPTATHAIVDAGMRAGQRPYFKRDRRG